eukprot:CAMPEP_0178838556 /NCGR_PEP_ID=MMETSP0746-20121128/13380_1 /TAXON_ID=913974 /ORGANISM="Nitzschia punctata, Strain CCMP561" /LENGTH=60 /DNA_ID=CAMNT_0020501519 /DNA_START=42 /DNA_END=224 /DNA_ORIENTATION=+
MATESGQVPKFLSILGVQSEDVNDDATVSIEDDAEDDDASIMVEPSTTVQTEEHSTMVEP